MGLELEPFDEWWQRHGGDDNTLWFVVRDNDEIVALLHGTEGVAEAASSTGSARKPGRRQGSARALLLHAFCQFQRRGANRVGLGVDAENPTGATRLYESVGMRVEADHVTFVKELT